LGVHKYTFHRAVSLREHGFLVPGGIGVGQITYGIMLLLIYSFTFTSAFMQ